MAWSYLVICVFDFLGGPVMNAMIAVYTKIPYQAWEPMTLRGGGLYHLAMAAIVGIATWSRGIEKKIMLERGESDEDDGYPRRRRRPYGEDDEDRPHRNYRNRVPHTDEELDDLILNTDKTRPNRGDE